MGTAGGGLMWFYHWGVVIRLLLFLKNKLNVIVFFFLSFFSKTS